MIQAAAFSLLSDSETNRLNEKLIADTARESKRKIERAAMGRLSMTEVDLDYVLVVDDDDHHGAEKKKKKGVKGKAKSKTEAKKGKKGKGERKHNNEKRW